MSKQSWKGAALLNPVPPVLVFLGVGIVNFSPHAKIH